MIDAYYVAAVAQACPGLFSESHIRFHLPQERGWAYIHSRLGSLGMKSQWPQDMASRESGAQLAAKYQ